uniref:CCHC-type domain-containing protein n=1 Tax=Strongyloides stercoralis TaxID=6248 RepID=A0A0K0ETQ1_STRER
MEKSLLIEDLTTEMYGKLKLSVTSRKLINVSLTGLINLLDTIYKPEKNNLVVSYSERLKKGLAQCYFDNVMGAKDMLATLVFTRGLLNRKMKKAILQQHRIKPNSSSLKSFNTAMEYEIIKGTEPSQTCLRCKKVGHLKYVCKSKGKVVGAINGDSESDIETIISKSEVDIYAVCENLHRGNISTKLNDAAVKFHSNTRVCKTLLSKKS